MFEHWLVQDLLENDGQECSAISLLQRCRQMKLDPRSDMWLNIESEMGMDTVKARQGNSTNLRVKFHFTFPLCDALRGWSF
jgi:hypothetical protein